MAAHGNGDNVGGTPQRPQGRAGRRRGAEGRGAPGSGRRCAPRRVRAARRASPRTRGYGRKDPDPGGARIPRQFSGGHATDTKGRYVTENRGQYSEESKLVSKW